MSYNTNRKLTIKKGMIMSKQRWIPFDLDVNFFVGTFETLDKWKNLVGRYRDINGNPKDITKAKQIERKEDLSPSFSFKGTGKTLAEWAKENGVDLHVI